MRSAFRHLSLIRRRRTGTASPSWKPNSNEERTGSVDAIRPRERDHTSSAAIQPRNLEKMKFSRKIRWFSKGILSIVAARGRMKLRMAGGTTSTRRALGAIASGAVLLASPVSHADTLEGALVQAYQNNPSLNAQRASVRATDEGVPTALAGYRPRVTANASAGELYQETKTKITTPGAPSPFINLNGTVYPVTYGVTATQTLFNGFQTGNRTRQAESLVFAARETLRSTEQTVLLNAATAYMNLLRDTAILDLQKRNVEVLQEQLRQTRDRFNVGEVTRTDVAQSESRLAAGRSAVLTA